MQRSSSYGSINNAMRSSNDKIAIDITQEQHHPEQSFREFLSYLHYKLKVPAGAIEKALHGLAYTITSYGGLPINIATIAKGWPDARPKLIVPLLFSGIAPGLLGLLHAYANTTHHERAKKAFEDAQIVNDSFNKTTYLLRTMIAVYVFMVSNYGKNNDEIDSSLGTFLLLTGASAIPAIGSTIYNIWNNHSPVKNKTARFLGTSANILATGALVQDTIENFYPGQLTSNYTLQLAAFGTSLLTGCAIVGGSIFSPKKVEFLTDCLSAANVVYILTEMYKQLEEENELSNGQKAGLFTAWFLMLALPIAITFGVAYQQHRHAHALGEEGEREPLLNHGEHNDHQIEVISDNEEETKEIKSENKINELDKKLQEAQDLDLIEETTQMEIASDQLADKFDQGIDKVKQLQKETKFLLTSSDETLKEVNMLLNNASTLFQDAFTHLKHAESILKDVKNQQKKDNAKNQYYVSLFKEDLKKPEHYPGDLHLPRRKI